MTSTANLGRKAIEALRAFGSQTASPGGTTLSAAEMIAAAEDVASRLRSGGSQLAEPIVLLVGNEPFDVAGFLGIWLADCTAVPIHSTTPTAVARTLVARIGSRFSIQAAKLSESGAAPPAPRPLLIGAALVVFTSGSTGEPKGVVLGHEGLCWKLDALARLLTFTRDDVVAVPLQLTFIFGIWVSLLALLSGSSLLLTPKLTAAGVPEKATVLAAVPTLLRSLCTEPSFTAGGVRKLLTGGEPFSPALSEKVSQVFWRARVFDLFGLTETGSCDFCALSDAGAPSVGTIGRPTEGVSFRILRDPTLPGDAGELQIRTPARMLGYLDDPPLTEKAFDGDYFKTGDLALLREDGHVQLVGRSKDVISRGGNKIGPLEIENLFARHQGVAAVLAFGMPDDRLGETLHLMIVRRDPHLIADDLRLWAGEHIDRFKLPDAIHFVDALPTGRTGKADRAIARAAMQRPNRSPDRSS